MPESDVLPYDPLLREVLASIGNDSQEEALDFDDCFAVLEEQDLAVATAVAPEDDLPFTCCPVCNKDNLTRDDIFARCTCSAWFLPKDTPVGVPEARILPRNLFLQIPKR